MSGTPKRGPHEDSGHSSSSSMRPSHGSEKEHVHAPPQPSVNYAPPIQDSRAGLLPRPESIMGMSPFAYNQGQRVLPSFNNLRRPEVRMESKDYNKEVKESKGAEGIREAKVESNEASHQSSKVEKEVRIDDSKEVNHERDRNRGQDLKTDAKVENHVYGKSGSVPNWKDHSLKKHLDVSGGGGSSGIWNGSQIRGKIDAPKDVVMKEHGEGNEAVGENRVDLKSDDKYKDRKQKEGKRYDWPEGDKDRSDFRSNLQGGSSNSEYKETTREEREPKRWGEMDVKEAFKEKDRLLEKYKHLTVKDGRNSGEKEGNHSEKDAAEKASVPETFASGLKKPTDSWRNLEREAKERRRERDGDMEGERPEKRQCVDKESDDGVADGDGCTDKEKDTFSYAVQQKKRMLRPRVSPLVNRDALSKSRGQDAEGSQGKPEASAVYKVGECLQELIKLWKEFESSHADKSSDNVSNGPILEIRIPAEHVTATNRQVRGGQLWGTDIYTDDSDLVAVLMHTGYCRPTASPPPVAIQELRATIRLLPPQESYVSSLRNNVRSRAWGAAIGCSYRIERCCIIKKEGGSIDLEPCLTQTSGIEPTLAPVAVERTMTTRAAASNALRQQRFVREVTIQYNLCNEPWIKYSLSIVADKGLKKPQYTSARLKKGEVLYLETHLCRYELCFTNEKVVKAPSISQMHDAEAEKSQNHVPSMNGDRSTPDGDNVIVDMFRWSRCKKPLPQKAMLTIGIPLPLEHVEVLEDNLDWEDVQWSQTSVWIAGKEYQLARVHFLSQN